MEVASGEPYSAAESVSQPTPARDTPELGVGVHAALPGPVADSDTVILRVLGGEFFNDYIDLTPPQLFGALVSLPNADALPSNTPGVPFSASPLLTFTFDA
jgi:hypothetical protein